MTAASGATSGLGRRVPPSIRTGTAALIGAKAVVLDRVDADGGRIKLGGEVWTARAYDEDEVIEQGRKEAERIIADARTEAARLVSRTEVMQTATKEADRVVTEAKEAARQMKLEAEDYVDAKLANFEVVLHKTLGAVERGRDKLRGRHELEELRDETLTEDPLPEH